MAQQKTIKRKDPVSGLNLRDGEFIRQSDGLYVYRFTCCLGKRKQVTAKTLRILREKEKEVKEQVEQGIDTAKAKTLTLNTLFCEGLDLRTREGTLRPSTAQNYRGMWNHNLSEFGQRKIADVTPLQIRKLIADWNEAGLSKSTIKMLTGFLSQCFDDAVSCHAVKENILNDKTIKTAKRNAKKEAVREALTPDQQERLVAFVTESSLYRHHLPLITVALYTGLRVGELTGLTWNNIDLENGCLHVRHQLRYGKKSENDKSHFYIQIPKTAAGLRTVYFGQEVQDALKEQRKLNFQLGRFCKTEIDGISDFIFLTNGHMPYATNGINFMLDRIVSAYNKENPDNQLPHISAHILRHSYGTRAIENGCSPKALQEQMGHSKISVTLDVYAKPNNEEWKRAEILKLSKAN